MPNSYTPFSATFGQIKLKNVWIVDVPEGYGIADVDTSVPTGSLAMVATVGMYVKKSDGWKEITTAT